MLKLVDGTTEFEGRIEYAKYNMTNAIWHVICGEYLGINEVIVICSHLQYAGANRAVMDSPFGETDLVPDSYFDCDSGRFLIMP